MKFYRIFNNILIKEYSSEDICKLFNITESMLNDKIKDNDLDFIMLEQFFGVEGYCEFIKVYLDKKECLKIVEATFLKHIKTLEKLLQRNLLGLENVRKELNS